MTCGFLCSESSVVHNCKMPGQIFIIGRNGESFCDNGDSGSFVWDQTGKLIGLLHGKIANVCVVTPIQVIEDFFKVKVIPAHHYDEIREKMFVCQQPKQDVVAQHFLNMYHSFRVCF